MARTVINRPEYRRCNCGDDVFDYLDSFLENHVDADTTLRTRELEESALREIDMIASGKTKHFPDDILSFFANMSVREIGEKLGIGHDDAREVQRGAAETLAMRRECLEEGRRRYKLMKELNYA